MANDRYTDIDSLLNGVFKTPTLKELFEIKINELDITTTAVLELLNIQHRTLYGILDGTQKTVDYTNLIKLANFLQVSKEQVVKLYFEQLEKNFAIEHSTADKIKFIKDNFDLAALKKAGLINSISNFKHIEERLLSRLGLKSIYEYKKPNQDIAFSSGLFKPKNENTRAFWIKAAMTAFEEINNPYQYDREALVKLFPQIRWRSTNVELGLTEVIKLLYKVGVTVIYQPPLQTLQLRGATFSVHNKPCIVLTNYHGFYATLWFALIHELYHVLFDWEEICNNTYHLSDDNNEQLSVLERENEADAFAREYLFSKEKTDAIRRFINDEHYIQDHALENHVHPSIVYVFNAFDVGKMNKAAWAKARKMSPDVNKSIKSIEYPWNELEAVEDFYKQKKYQTYN